MLFKEKKMLKYLSFYNNNTLKNKLYTTTKYLHDLHILIFCFVVPCHLTFRILLKHQFSKGEIFLLMTEFRVQTSHPHRLLGVLGDRGKTNDVIFCKSPFECSNTLVFFPGDVQDYLEEMSPEFSEYNIGSTASLLSSSFPDHHILVIKPNRMELKTYACYDNFVSSNKLGIPNLTSSHCHDTINHLDKLLQSVAQRTEVSSITRCKLTLVGFSKGCVVLNALLYSMFSHPSHPFLSSISDMVWLDGGHGGNTNTWVTDHSILENFTKLGIGVSIFVSPYQVSDVRRPWIHQEEQKFHETLRHLGVSTMKRKLLAQDLPVSLKSHFLLLKLAVQARFS